MNAKLILAGLALSLSLAACGNKGGDEAAAPADQAPAAETTTPPADTTATPPADTTGTTTGEAPATTDGAAPADGAAGGTTTEGTTTPAQ